MSNKLTLHSCYAQNFRSIGMPGMALNYEDAADTLGISEDNGQGKSTMLVHAPFYCLFDKAYGDGDKKTSLINSFNRKDTLVRLEFTPADGKRYQVTRGMKPTIFDIKVLAENGEYVALDQEAGLDCHQDVLDEIIGIDANIFCNAIALGIDKFKPFINMKTAERRPFVERILGLEVFTKMSDKAKDQLKTLKTAMSDAEYLVKQKQIELQGKQEVLALQESNAQEKVDRINADIKSAEDELKPVDEEISNNSKKLDMIKVKLNGIEDGQRDELDVAAGNEAQERSDLNNDHQKAKADLANDHNEELSPVTQEWNDKLAEFDADKDKTVDKAKAEEMGEVQKVSAGHVIAITGFQATYDDLEAKKEPLVQTVADRQRDLDDAKRDVRENELDIKQIKNDIESTKLKIKACYERGTCPHCTQEIPDELNDKASENDRKHVAELESKLDTHEDQIGGLQSSVDAAEQELSYAKEAVEEADKDIATAKVLLDDAKEASSREINAVKDAARDKINAVISELTEKRTEIVLKQQATLNELTTKHTKATSELELAQTQADNDLKAKHLKIVNDLKAAHVEQTAKLKEMQSTVDANQSAQKTLKGSIGSRLSDLRRELSDLESKASFDFDGAKGEIDALELEVSVLDAEYEKMEDRQKALLALTNQILTDKGIKASILDKYLPFINQRVNAYLNSMGVYLSLEMDNAYNITMNAPDRRGQTVYSLSNGQKARLNCAFMLAWRDVADLRSSVSTNLLVLDETLENVSENGVKEAIDLVKEAAKGKNLFVVSQRNSEFEEHFSNILKYTLKDGYTHRIR